MEMRTIRVDSPNELPSALSSLREDGCEGALALVFTSAAHAKNGVGKIFADAGFEVFGGTTAGEVLVSDDAECVFDDSIVAAILQVDRDAYRLELFEAEGRGSRELGREVGEWARETFSEPAILLLSGGMRADGEQILEGVFGGVGRTVPVFGGFAGDGQRFSESFVFDGASLCGDGVLALAFDGTRVEMRGMAASGWQPIGVEKVVTRSEGNVVYTIDGVPALDLYREYLGLTSMSASTGEVMALGEAPLQIVRDGYTVLRAAMVADPEARSLTFAGTVPEGARVRFSTSPGPEIAEAALQAMKRLREDGAEADALLLFSCAARRFSLGPMAEDEVRPIQALWGAPMAGMFTYGEIGSVDGGRSDFHNETCVLVALRDR